MDIKIETVLSQNITIAYDSLRLQTIDSGELKKLVGGDAQPIMMDTPEMIVAVYPPEPTVVQMGQNHISITLAQARDELGGIPLWEIAANCHRLASQAVLIAYGFNYDVGVTLAQGHASQTMIALFVPDRAKIEAALEGGLLQFIPRVKFERDEILYDLMLEPMDEQRIKVHLNAHFESRGTALPAQEDLRAAYYKEYALLCSILPRLFKGDE